MCPLLARTKSATCETTSSFFYTTMPVEPTAFCSYASPPPHLAFPLSFFNVLTIAQAAERSYPIIAPIGSVMSAKILPEVPLSAVATVIIPGEVIPNYNDLKTLTSARTYPKLL